MVSHGEFAVFVEDKVIETDLVDEEDSKGRRICVDTVPGDGVGTARRPVAGVAGAGDRVRERAECGGEDDGDRSEHFVV